MPLLSGSRTSSCFSCSLACLLLDESSQRQRHVWPPLRANVTGVLRHLAGPALRLENIRLLQLPLLVDRRSLRAANVSDVRRHRRACPSGSRRSACFSRLTSLFGKSMRAANVSDVRRYLSVSAPSLQDLPPASSVALFVDRRSTRAVNVRGVPRHLSVPAPPGSKKSRLLLRSAARAHAGSRAT